MDIVLLWLSYCDHNGQGLHLIAKIPNRDYD